MLNRRVLGVAHLSSQLRSTQPTPLSIRFQFPNLHRQLNVSDAIPVFSPGPVGSVLRCTRRNTPAKTPNAICIPNRTGFSKKTRNPIIS